MAAGIERGISLELSVQVTVFEVPTEFVLPLSPESGI
jgi:hypothetical protein